ncbi:hypothetical protein OE88DRAFT_1638775 [Heliocybe sulcata]|uniref:Uncharacterized protein n=1 Tax=Heliocybe sulcata TaxID=5364 RepID=A0A5C3ML46_9AGAM|nr:hypothetical protein OE88DRAFT_1638775 [Heliocybe sulcata]
MPTPLLIATLVDALREVRSTVEAVQKLKDYLGCQFLSFFAASFYCKRSPTSTSSSGLTVFPIQCVQTQATFRRISPSSITSPARAVAAFPLSSDTRPGSASAFEKAVFYKGISEEHPHLLQHSDVMSRPFILPPPEGRHTAIPDKRAHGVFDPILTPDLWRQQVGPAIVNLLAETARNIHVSTMVPIRFSVSDNEGKPIFDEHIVIWISVFPGSTAEEACRDANTPILAILEKHQVKDAAVHWIEGTAERFIGPAMMHVGLSTNNPDQPYHRALTAVLSVPIAPHELRRTDAQGTLGIFFHEGRQKDGNKSNRVMAFTNKHVVSDDTATDYVLGGHGALRQWVRTCGLRRFEQVQQETRTFIAKKVHQVKHVAEQLDVGVFTSERSRGIKEAQLERLKEDVRTLHDFLRLLNATWSEGVNRAIGWLEWAPKIQNDIDQRRYTWDGAVLELDKAKWAKEYMSNHVYLSEKFDPYQFTRFFYPNHSDAHSFEFPYNHLFRIQGCIDAEGLKTPQSYDKLGKPCFIVAKAGQTTNLTFGHLSGCEAYVVRDSSSSSSSWELAIFNSAGENFSYRGDSGACVFNVEGKMVAFLHSGMPRGMASHVTFGMPAHFVLDQIRKRYPYADFDRDTFFDGLA